jgi:HSP20 family protein
MSSLMRKSSPWSEMLDWFESGSPFTRGIGLTPYVRVEDFVDEGTYVIRAELPGIDPDKDVQVEVDSDSVTIKGERREEKKDKQRTEFHYGSFSRTVPLPRGASAEDVKASYKDGVLEVRIPAATQRAESRRIEVARGE